MRAWEVLEAVVCMLFGLLLFIYSLGMSDRWHVYNEMEEPEHESSDRCWCGPYLYFTSPTGQQIWIHRRVDPLDSGPPQELLEEVFNDCLESE